MKDLYIRGNGRTISTPEWLSLTTDALYNAGYADGKSGKAMEPACMSKSAYKMGYEDGRGDASIEKPSSDEFSVFNDAPEGFEYTGEKRVPMPYEFYLSKNGNATFLTRERKNSQKRHILRCSDCGMSKTHGMDPCEHHGVTGRD